MKESRCHKFFPKLLLNSREQVILSYSMETYTLYFRDYKAVILRNF
jgi:hypothetical protein